jgi:uncharacterized integral membrane protein (TIGR00697 family)
VPDDPAASLEQRRLAWLLVAAGGYVAASLTANVMSVRIVEIAGFSVDAGTLTYPLTFTLRDVVHKVGGVRAARTTIVATAAFNVLLAVALWAAASLPADPAVGPQREFGQVLVGTWRIVVASIAAQVVAELVDTGVYQRWVRRFGSRRQWGRVLWSNAVSVPVDSVVFTLAAFWGEVPAGTIVSVVVANVAIKGATSVLTTPAIYATRGVADVSVSEQRAEARATGREPAGS